MASASTQRVGPPRKPLIALGLSLLVPGLGHLYAGRPACAAGWYVLSVVAAFAAVALLYSSPLGDVSLALAIALVVAVYCATAVAAMLAAHRAPQPYVLRPYNRGWSYAGLFVGLALAGWGVDSVVQSQLVQAFRMPSSAMAPTLLIGDHFFISRSGKLTTATAGEVVVFESPVEPGVPVVKRVVGVAGDTLAMVRDTLYRNSTPLSESYVQYGDPAFDPADPRMQWQLAYLADGDAATYHPSLRSWGPIVVPPAKVFVLGDNRGNSYDSRFFGFVDQDRIEGRAQQIYFSYGDVGAGPASSGRGIRWGRIGMRIR